MRRPAAIALVLVALVAIEAPHALAQIAPTETPKPSNDAFALPKTGPAWPFVTLTATDPKALLQSTASSWERVTARQPGNDSPDRLPDVPWNVVCKAPCDQRVDPGLVYRVGGPNIVPSAPFQLPPQDRRVQLHGHAGAKSGRITGFVIGGIGLGVAAIGGFRLVATQDEFGADSVRTEAKLEVGIGGFLALLGFLLASANKTSVDLR